MAVLARDSPLRARLRMDAWLEQLLYIAADAAATVSTAAPLSADRFMQRCAGVYLEMTDCAVKDQNPPV